MLFEQVISSVSLRRLKLYNKLGLEDVVEADKREWRYIYSIRKVVILYYFYNLDLI